METATARRPVAAEAYDDILKLQPFLESWQEAGKIARPLGVGEIFPSANGLLDEVGKAFDLQAVINAQPVFLIYYRGGWCEYACTELAAYQVHARQIEANGAKLIAVSTDPPVMTGQTAKTRSLRFPLLCDPGGELADALGVRLKLTPPLQDLLYQQHLRIPAQLSSPLPATYVIKPGGEIAFAQVDLDYHGRVEAAIVRKGLRALERLSI